MSDAEQTRKGLEAAIRAARLALFVIRKQDVMPNSSWESGFNADLKAAEDALAALPQSKADSRGPFFLTQWEREDYERGQRGEKPLGPSVTNGDRK